MSHTGDALRHLRDAWRASDFEARFAICCVWFGCALIAISTTIYFGWPATVFWIGNAFYVGGRRMLETD